MDTAFHIQELVTLPGAHTVPQLALAEDMRRRLDGLEAARKAAQMVGFIYERSGIRERHLELTPEEIDGRPDWYRLVNEAVFSLSVRTLDALFRSDRVLPGQCDGLVVVSSSYAGFPGLSRRLQDHFGFPLDALCHDVTAMGCGGPTQGLFLAQTLLSQGACRKVAMVCVDVMGTHGMARQHRTVPSISQLVAHCLASDGAAALVLGAEPGSHDPLSYTKGRLVTRLWPRALDLNDFTADEHNQPFISVGKDIRTRLLDEVGDWLEAHAPHDPILMHPGGTALMSIIAERYPALADSVALSLSVLEGHGNIGAASVLWVLERALNAQVRLAPRFHLFALGPGIVTTALELDGVVTP